MSIWVVTLYLSWHLSSEPATSGRIHDTCRCLAVDVSSCPHTWLDSFSYDMVAKQSKTLHEREN